MRLNRVYLIEAKGKKGWTAEWRWAYENLEDAKNAARTFEIAGNRKYRIVGLERGKVIG